jgi:hypothetical protein
VLVTLGQKRRISRKADEIWFSHDNGLRSAVWVGLMTQLLLRVLASGLRDRRPGCCESHAGPCAVLDRESGGMDAVELGDCIWRC